MIAGSETRDSTAAATRVMDRIEMSSFWANAQAASAIRSTEGRVN
jgi:hypothetical protein